MTKINYKSDFDFILKLKDCADPKKTVPFPDGNFDARFWTSSKANAYTASYRDGVYTNCFRTEDGGMHFVFDDHRMGKGTLHWEPHFELPNDIYPDNMQDLYRKAALDIELVDGDGDCPTTAELEAMLPYIKGEPFTFEDFTPEQIAELQRPATEAASSVLKLETAVETAEKKRIADEQSRQTAEQERVGAEETRVSNESIRQSNEQKREKAEADRQTAERERETKFATFEPAINGKQNKLLNSDDVTVGDDDRLSVTDSAKRAVFNDMFNLAAGSDGGYKPSEAPDPAKPYLLNTLWLSYEEAVKIYAINGADAGRYQPNISRRYSHYNGAPLVNSVRTLFKVCGHSQYYGMFFGDVELEVVNVDISGNLTWVFRGNSKLKTVLGTVEIYAVTSGDILIWDCALLEDVNLKGLRYNIRMLGCPKLSLATMQYLVDNASTAITAESPVVVTVHADVFAKLTGDTTNPAVAALTPAELAQWQQILTAATAKNISFTTP